MRRTFAAACGLVMVAVLAGCGSTTDNLDFKVPQGYTSKINTFLMSMWNKGDGSNAELIMLMKLPTKMDETKFDPQEISASGGAKNMKISKDEAIRICGDHPAHIIRGTATSEQAKGKDENLEMLVTGWDNNTYMAMYLYPQSAKPDPAAEAALKTVCQKAK